MFCFSGAIGILDIQKPEYGDATRFHDDDIAVFWPCGVTGLQAVLSASKISSFCYIHVCRYSNFSSFSESYMKHLIKE